MSQDSRGQASFARCLVQGTFRVWRWVISFRVFVLHAATIGGGEGGADTFCGLLP